MVFMYIYIKTRNETKYENIFWKRQKIFKKIKFSLEKNYSRVKCKINRSILRMPNFKMNHNEKKNVRNDED